MFTGAGRVIATLTVALDADDRIVTIHNVANPESSTPSPTDRCTMSGRDDPSGSARPAPARRFRGAAGVAPHVVQSRPISLPPMARDRADHAVASEPVQQDGLTRPGARRLLRRTGRRHADPSQRVLLTFSFRDEQDEERPRAERYRSAWDRRAAIAAEVGQHRGASGQQRQDLDDRPADLRPVADAPVDIVATTRKPRSSFRA